jgi:glycosyltransferase involved in cell wall biosynthesis
VLLNLASNLHDDEHIIVSLTPIEPGDLSARFQEKNITVLSLGMSLVKPWHMLKVFTLARLIKRYKPTVIQSWMYHANIMAGLAGRLAKICPVVWNIRNGALKPGEGYPLSWVGLTPWIVRLGAWLSSRFCTRIIYCATRAAEIHERWGYCPQKRVVIHNGIDTARFAPQPQVRLRVRLQWNINENQPVVGLLARFHPQKDVPTFLKAAALMRQTRGDVLFALCGADMNLHNKTLMDMMKAAGLEGHVMLMDHSDSAAFLNAIDVLCMTSAYGEAFPNVVAEALSCNTPCVVTDVGDAALIVGDASYVVAEGDYKNLARVTLQSLTEPKGDLRQRMIEQFTLTHMGEAYTRFYDTLARESA